MVIMIQDRMKYKLCGMEDGLFGLLFDNWVDEVKKKQSKMKYELSISSDFSVFVFISLFL